MKRYHHIYSQTMDPFDIVNQSYEEATRTWLCNGCKEPKPGVAEVDVVLDNPRITKVPLNIVNGCGVPVARKDFLFSFGEDLVRRDLYLGRVFDPDRKEITELVTFRGKFRLLVRGQKRVSHRICPECGRTRCSSMIGGRYVFPHPPEGVSLFESQLWGLVMPEEVFRRIDLSQWRKVTHEVLQVPPSPPDGLLDLVSIEDRRLTISQSESK